MKEIIVIIAAILTFVLGLVCGIKAGVFNHQKQAVQDGVGEFVATKEGEVFFRWKSKEPRYNKA